MRHRPLSIWDDIHWIDETSADLLKRFISKPVADVTGLLLITSRTKPLDGFGNVTPIATSPLTDDEVRKYIGYILNGRRFPEPAIQHILSACGGNPLFVRELAQALIDTGVVVSKGSRYQLTAPLELLNVPTTLQGSITARLDRLGAARNLAQIAAVIGRAFSVSLFADVTDIAVENVGSLIEPLVAAGLVTEVDHELNPSYSFRHALIQNAAYDTLTRDNRRAIHARVAHSLESRYSDLASQQPELIAWHYENADITEPAVDYYLRAARIGLSKCAAAESLRSVDRGLALIQRANNDNHVKNEISLQLSRGKSIILLKGEVDDQTGAAFSRALSLSRRIGQTDTLFESLDGLCVHHFSRRELDNVVLFSEELLSVAESTQNAAIEITGLRAMGGAAFLKGDFDRSIRSFSKVLSLYDDARDQALGSRTRIDPRVSSLAYISLAKLIKDQRTESLDLMSQAILLAQSRQKVEFGSLVFALRLSAFREALALDFDKTFSVADELDQLAEKLKLDLINSEAVFYKHWAGLRLGQQKWNLSGMRAALRRFAGARNAWPFFRVALGIEEFKNGNKEKGLQGLTDCVQSALNQGELWYLSETLRAIAEAKISVRYDTPSVDADLKRAETLASSQGAGLFISRIHETMAGLEHARSRPDCEAIFSDQVLERASATEANLPRSKTVM